MIKILKNQWEALKPELKIFWAKWRNETALVVTSLVLWAWSDNIINLLPIPTKGMDNTHLQSIIFAFVGVTFFAATSKIIMYLGWRDMDKTLDDEITTKWNQISEKTRLTISLCIYFLLFFAQVLLATFRN